MLDSLLRNHGSLVYAAIPAGIGFVASKIAIYVQPSIALRWTPSQAAVFIFANSLLKDAMKGSAARFFPQKDSWQHKIVVHLFPALITIAVCKALGCTIAKTNALVGVNCFVTTAYEAFEPHKFFLQRTGRKTD